jgi:predicted TIM-barrel fold metal-dependent hydrolase
MTTRESTSESAEYVVDADGHLCEPADLWERNLPASMRDRGIRLRWNEATGFDECLVEDVMATERGLVGLGNAGESFENFGQGRHYEDCNPAGFDAHERVKVLDSEGIDISVMYPGLGLKLGGITDPQLAVASCAVYNDWVADWCSAAPDRLKAVGALPMQDPEEAAREAYRIRDRGLVAGFARPNAYNNRPFHDPSYTPVWEALEATGLALGLHITGLADMPGAARGMGHLMAPGTQHAMIPVLDQMVTLSNLVYGGVLERHPGLKVAVLESGGGWIAHWMDRLNEFESSYWWAAAPMTLDAEHYFKRQCWISFDPGERTPGALGPIAGFDRFVWASDFPHNDAKYPGVVDELREHTGDLPDDARRAYFGLNALEMYGISAPSA